MTRKELEAEIYDVQCRIMDLFKDIQTNANALKSPDDRPKITAACTKIRDYTDEIYRWLDEYDRLSMETPEEDNQGNDDSEDW